MSNRGQRIAQIANAHAGSSSVQNVSTYQHIVRRPADQAPALDAFFLHNAAMSSCALTVVGAWRLAGCAEPEAVAPYFPNGGPERDAMVDVGALGRRCPGGWVSASMPMPLPQTGDAFIVADEHGNDAHTGIFTSDAVHGSRAAVNAPGGTFTASTVEGGQYSGKDSSAIGTFSRTFKCVANRWMLGNRYLLGYVRAEALPVSDEDPSPPSDPLPHEGESDTRGA